MVTNVMIFLPAGNELCRIKPRVGAAFVVVHGGLQLPFADVEFRCRAFGRQYSGGLMAGYGAVYALRLPRKVTVDV